MFEPEDLRIVTVGPRVGRAALILEDFGGAGILVTYDLYGKDPHPRNTQWVSKDVLRLPTEMELLGAMAE